MSELTRREVLDKVSGNAPKPEPASGGRTSARTGEEIVEFMDECLDSSWAEEYADGIRRYHNVGDEEDVGYPAKVGCAGLIARPITADQTFKDIIDTYNSES